MINLVPAQTKQNSLTIIIIQRENQVKHMNLYNERRFTKLGYSAAAILQALPYLCMLLNETHLSNQHVEIVQLFLDSEFFITEFSVLTYFTLKVTSPFLCCVELCSQEELLNIFPKLYKDLRNGNLETLNEYLITYNHITVNPPSTDIENQLLELVCKNAAAAFGNLEGNTVSQMKKTNHLELHSYIS